jgi:hypothetical protein
MTKLMIAALIGFAGVPGPTFAATASWTAFADCAAAYKANAVIKDPDRPASMSAMISEQSNDYRTAAAAVYRATTKATNAQSQDAVSARVAQRMPTLTKLSRDKLEQIIDACPQLPDQ